MGKKIKNNCLVQRNFKIEDKPEATGGLRLRLIFSITASGLSDSPYIAISGLNGEKLCSILCPDRFLAANVPGLCKGGDNVGNVSGFGLVNIHVWMRKEQVRQ